VANEPAVDIRRIRRLQAAIKGVLSMPQEASPTAGAEIAEQYNALRKEISLVLPEGLQAEFNRLFEDLPTSRRTPYVDDPFELAMLGNSARTRLSLLDGWLTGVLETEK
jgi:hypothetical protein